jgi:amidohydrolase
MCVDAMRLHRMLDAHEHELIALRRLLHTQPEESGAEHLTTELLVERLRLEGLRPVVMSTGTGVVCDLSLDPGAEPDPTVMPMVALRADIDALAMDDLVTADYRSRHPGFAHACGHDVHTAAVLGAAIALREWSASHPRHGIVRLIFEPAEETMPGGAVDVIADGWLRDVRAIFGVHCDPKLDVGRFGLRAGPLTSAADQFEITLRGPGGHTARPQLTVDLVRWTGRVADRLAAEVRALAPSDVILVFGAVHAGAAANVIPVTATLRGSFRTADRATWARGEALMRAALERILADVDADHDHDPDQGRPPAWELDYRRGLPPVVNDAGTTALVERTATAEFGPESVVDTPQSMGGDSFAWYTEEVPGTYVRLGTHDPADGGQRLDLHSATFDVDERAIVLGAALLASCALVALEP